MEDIKIVINNYTCNFCNITFSLKHHLQRHINENRCKSTLFKDAKDLHKLNEIICSFKPQNNTIKYYKNISTQTDFNYQDNVLHDFSVNDKLFNFNININPLIKDKIDIIKFGDIINKTLEKLLKQSHFKYKQYVMPSGKSVMYQGYENIALDQLLLLYDENNIENKRENVPTIKYIQKSKIHYYYPDIYIKSENLIIEVKSTWTYKKGLIKNILKALAAKKSGYKFEFWIYDDKKNKIII